MQLQEKFIKTAKDYSSKIAIYDSAMDKEITYGKLLIASLMLSKKFSKYKGEHLGIMIPNSIASAASILATLMAGKVPVMINYSTGASENCRYAQEKCSFKNIITSKKLLEKLEAEFVEGMVYIEDIFEKINLKHKLFSAVKSKLPTFLLKNFVHTGNEDESCVILFTSGSEKDPKAVELTHKNIMHNIETVPNRFHFTPKDVFLSNLPFFHVFGLTTTLWIPLLGANTIITQPNPLKFREACKLIRNRKVTIMIGTPSFFYGYLKKSEAGDFETVRIAVTGADKLHDIVRNGYRNEHDVEIYEGYGTTETSPVISANPPDKNKPGSIGPPLDGVQVKIQELKTGKTLPPNKQGKIMVKGDLVMKGYYGDIEETSLHINNGWYDTGDMGLIDEDGFLWHKGRLRRFVKVGGEMVSLVRVESELEKLLPNGAVCCVVDVPNPTKGADIVAAVTTTKIDKKKILKKLRKRLPKIAVPKAFHVIEDIPMMGTGKVNFREVETICRDLEDNK
ncbi:MAG: AMP-binding protein [Candidatus Cloacimonetes bacterium]|nr:AMP-binding protein [Candidatus Cloacimonadota bacterium]MBS3767558.1 AMP-binding protein [Candidatus Cloacimonadota bacterium]